MRPLRPAEATTVRQPTCPAAVCATGTVHACREVPTPPSQAEPQISASFVEPRQQRAPPPGHWDVSRRDARCRHATPYLRQLLPQQHDLCTELTNEATPRIFVDLPPQAGESTALARVRAMA